MDKKSLVDVRNILFTTIDRLIDAKDESDREGKKPIDLETAKEISKACSIIVDSARVEMNVLKSIANAQNPQLLISFMKNAGLIQEIESKLITEGNDDH